MIARLAQWQPRAGLGREDALRAWAEHATVVELLPGLRRYAQHHAITGPDGSESLYAGLGEVCFDDLDAARAALISPEWSTVIEDAGRFMNLSSVVVTWVEERVVLVPS